MALHNFDLVNGKPVLYRPDSSLIFYQSPQINIVAGICLEITSGRITVSIFFSKDTIQIKGVNAGTNAAAIKTRLEAEIFCPAPVGATPAVDSTAAKFVQVATYAAFAALATPAVLTIVKVANDESRDKTNTVYQLWPDGTRIWLLTVEN